MACDANSIMLQGFQITFQPSLNPREFCYLVTAVNPERDLSHLIIGVECPGSFLQDLDCGTDVTLTVTGDPGLTFTCEIADNINQQNPILGIKFDNIQNFITGDTATFCITFSPDIDIFQGCVNVSTKIGNDLPQVSAQTIPGPTCTPPMTTTPVTTAPVTTAPVTTAPVTTAPVTTAPVTTAPVTTAPVTTAPMTTAPMTTAPMTTAPMTTAPMTTAPVTTRPCPVANPQSCCQIMVEGKTQLVGPALFNPNNPSQFPVSHKTWVEARVEAVCPEKVVICGVVHKEIHYLKLNDLGQVVPGVTFDDHSFQCFIDRDDANEGDQFDIVGASILCNVFGHPTNFGHHPNFTNFPVAWRFVEKEIVKVCIRKR